MIPKILTEKKNLTFKLIQLFDKKEARWFYIYMWKKYATYFSI